MFLVFASLIYFNIFMNNYNNTYLSNFSQNTMRVARSKWRLVLDISKTLTAHLATFLSNFISSNFK